MSESPPPPLRRRRNATVFRPRFSLMILYLAAFYVLFAMLFALPDLIEAARALPPGPEELSPEELERAKQVAHQALGGGRLLLALGAAVVAVGLAAYAKQLPGLR